MQEIKKHSHYYKDVSDLKEIDVYRVLALWNVTDPCLQHALKKILVAGGRGHKDISKDVQEAIDTLERWKEMQKEVEPVKSHDVCSNSTLQDSSVIIPKELHPVLNNLSQDELKGLTTMGAKIPNIERRKSFYEVVVDNFKHPF